MNNSPSVALNRIYALYKVKGAETAIGEVANLFLENNHFYFVLLGELYRNINPERSQNHFKKTLSITKIQAEKQLIQDKINSLPGIF